MTGDEGKHEGKNPSVRAAALLLLVAGILVAAYVFREPLAYLWRSVTGREQAAYEVPDSELRREFDRKCSELSEEEIASYVPGSFAACVKDMPCEEAGPPLKEKGLCL